MAYTVQPTCARWRAVAAPIPEEQPVIRTAREGVAGAGMAGAYARRVETRRYAVLLTRAGDLVLALTLP